MPPIDPLSRSVQKYDSVAYWIPGALIAASLILGIGVTIIPKTALAFWPFSVLKASESTGDLHIVPDASLRLLEAAVNPDPSPAQVVDELSVSEGSALIANAGVDGTLTEGDTTSSSGTISTYLVKSGDSISAIAKEYGVSVDTILWANGLTRKSAIAPGTTLVILPVSGVRHVVGKGETLVGIARALSADAGEIASFNGLDDSAPLVAGSILIIPGGELSVPATKKPTTSVKTVAKIKTGGGMGVVRAVGDTSRTASFVNPAPQAHLSQSLHGWNGVDLAGHVGSPVLAAASGVVIVSRVGGWGGGYGNYIVIDHGDGTQTLYGHLSSDNVSVGERVSAGERIGSIGNTGNSTGPHLHFEVRGAKNPFAK